MPPTQRGTAGAFGIALPVPRLRRGSLAQRDGDAAARLPMRQCRPPLRHATRACAPGFGRQGEKAGIGQGPYLAVGVRIQDTGPGGPPPPPSFTLSGL